MTNTTSEFGRELDSLADIISFGIAPAILAYVWGVQFVGSIRWPRDARSVAARRQIHRVSVSGLRRGPPGALQHPEEPASPRIPGAPNRKYFVGLPIPAAAGMVAAVVLRRSTVIRSRISSRPALWLALLGLLSFLMVSTWRYWSFKELNLLRPALAADCWC